MFNPAPFSLFDPIGLSKNYQPYNEATQSTLEKARITAAEASPAVAAPEIEPQVR